MMITKFAVKFKKNDLRIKYFDTFDDALKYARANKAEHPYTEIRFTCLEDTTEHDDTLVNGYLSVTVWTAQDDIEA